MSCQTIIQPLGTTSIYGTPKQPSAAGQAVLAFANPPCGVDGASRSAIQNGGSEKARHLVNNLRVDDI